MLDVDRRASRLPDHTTAAQGQLVLIDSCGQPGANNRPALTALARRQPDTMLTPNRRAAAIPIASTASANKPPADTGTSASTANVNASAVNAARTASARNPNRRSQPRTVESGRLNPAAMLRCPNPTALPASADPITSTSSARRANALTGSST